MNSYIDTEEVWRVLNIATWYDGTLRPGRGHRGTCQWFFDGQFWYHVKDL